MVDQNHWNGTQAEGMELTTAFARNCSCKYGLMGIKLETCVAHLAFAHDQRMLDGLLTSRRRRAELLIEEGITDDDHD